MRTRVNVTVMKEKNFLVSWTGAFTGVNFKNGLIWFYFFSPVEPKEKKRKLTEKRKSPGLSEDWK